MHARDPLPEPRPEALSPVGPRELDRLPVADVPAGAAFHALGEAHDPRLLILDGKAPGQADLHAVGAAVALPGVDRDEISLRRSPHDAGEPF